MLEEGITKEEPLDARLERRLTSGLFLLLAGIALIIFPSIARVVGLEVGLTFELLVMGIVVFCAGLAMLLGYWILRRGLP